jgi:hypothetical protein
VQGLATSLFVSDLAQSLFASGLVATVFVNGLPTTTFLVQDLATILLGNFLKRILIIKPGDNFSLTLHFSCLHQRILRNF